MRNMDGGQVQKYWLQQPYTYSWAPVNMLNYSNPYTAPVTTSTFQSVPNSSLPTSWSLSSPNLDNVANLNNETKKDLTHQETPFQYPKLRPSSGSKMLTDIQEQPESPKEIVQTFNRSPITKQAKRRVQNRIAQKLFRKRKQEHVETLEKQVIYLKQQLELCRQENNCLHGLSSHNLDNL
ncbi:hypothetical protein N7467_002256 [Penicillium canescens]|nr:hypothetical protein N7467_002256 [Penicillium canescens]